VNASKLIHGHADSLQVQTTPLAKKKKKKKKVSWYLITANKIQCWCM